VLTERRGLLPAHYDIRFVKPLDEALLHEVFKKFNKVITVEDGCMKVAWVAILDLWPIKLQSK